MLHLILKCTSKQENSMPKRFFNILSNHRVGELQLSSSSHNAAFGGSNQINLMSSTSLGSRESSTQTECFPSGQWAISVCHRFWHKSRILRDGTEDNTWHWAGMLATFKVVMDVILLKKKKKKVMAGKMVYVPLWAVGKLGSR